MSHTFQAFLHSVGCGSGQCDINDGADFANSAGVRHHMFSCFGFDADDFEFFEICIDCHGGDDASG